MRIKLISLCLVGVVNSTCWALFRTPLCCPAGENQGYNNRSSNHQTSNVSIGWDVTELVVESVKGVLVTSVKDSVRGTRDAE